MDALPPHPPEDVEYLARIDSLFRAEDTHEWDGMTASYTSWEGRFVVRRGTENKSVLIEEIKSRVTEDMDREAIWRIVCMTAYAVPYSARIRLLFET